MEEQKDVAEQTLDNIIHQLTAKADLMSSISGTASLKSNINLTKVGAVQFQLKQLKKDLDQLCIKPNIIEENLFIEKALNPGKLGNQIDDEILAIAVKKFKIKETNLIDYWKAIKMISLLYKMANKTPTANVNSRSHSNLEKQSPRRIFDSNRFNSNPYELD